MSTIKRKQPESISPIEEIRSCRRRFLSASPTANIIITMSSPPHITGTITPNQQHTGTPTQPVLTEASTEGNDLSQPTSPLHSDIVQSLQFSMNDLTSMVMTSMQQTQYMNTFAPMVAHALTPFITSTIHDALNPLVAKVADQSAKIEKQRTEIDDLHKSRSELEAKVSKLKDRILTLERCGLDRRVSAQEQGLEELEQYGRRNSLRFQNVSIPESTTDTDETIVNLCKTKLNVDITKEDICRSHPVGRPKRSGKGQIICRFRNWKIKNSIFSKKKLLRGDSDKIFITEDLTRYRQSIISALSDAKRMGYVHSYWTNDGRIFAKASHDDYKSLITSPEDVDTFVCDDNYDYMQY
ncbi:hypothetical protein FSP39_003009 [Pinctada imbricata]|uniref:Uncharacterized protein n=1 Tax=Pinctada imbricata TaxID=66713 RepID=A0AA88YPL6_PINIB|nr:hypothetical protein FSP39_003009 [Pinctada imbricata]